MAQRLQIRQVLRQYLPVLVPQRRARTHLLDQLHRIPPGRRIRLSASRALRPGPGLDLRQGCLGLLPILCREDAVLQGGPEIDRKPAASPRRAIIASRA